MSNSRSRRAAHLRGRPRSAWGEKALDQIDGMYALAFYHAASRRVLLARDPFGIKPLYVARSNQAFVFASEVRTVLDDEWIRLQWSEWLRAAALAALPAGKRAKAVDLVAGGGSCVELAASLRRVTSGRDLRSLGLDSKSLGLSEQYLPASAFDAFTDPGGDPFNAVSQAESFLYMGNTLLRDADVNSMAHSLEIRVPFLGRWLVDLVGAMPGSVKAPKGAPPKHLLRKAAGAILPHDLFSRPKRGFTLPIGEWMFGPLRAECEAAIETVAACSALNGAAVRRLWDSYRSQPGAIHWSRPLALVVLGNSLRQ